MCIVEVELEVSSIQVILTLKLAKNNKQSITTRNALISNNHQFVIFKLINYLTSKNKEVII